MKVITVLWVEIKGDRLILTYITASHLEIESPNSRSTELPIAGSTQAEIGQPPAGRLLR